MIEWVLSSPVFFEKVVSFDLNELAVKSEVREILMQFAISFIRERAWLSLYMQSIFKAAHEKRKFRQRIEGEVLCDVSSGSRLSRSGDQPVLSDSIRFSCFRSRLIRLLIPLDAVSSHAGLLYFLPRAFVGERVLMPVSG